MPKRYVPNRAFVTVDKRGTLRRFNPDYKQRDGTLGYTEEQIVGLENVASFRVITVDTGEVEQATAAPGEKRTLSGSRGHQCDQCEFAAKTKAGLTAHMRVHEEDDGPDDE